MPDPTPSLLEAARFVLAEMHARIDAAHALGLPVPVFGGIAQLAQAIIAEENARPVSHPLLLAEIRRLESELARVRAGLAVIEEDAGRAEARARHMPESATPTWAAAVLEELALAARIARNDP